MFFISKRMIIHTPMTNDLSMMLAKRHDGRCDTEGPQVIMYLDFSIGNTQSLPGLTARRTVSR